MNPTLRDTLRAWSASPYPAWAFTTGLGIVPLVRPPDQPAAQQPPPQKSSMFSFKKAYKPTSAYPTTASALLFGGLIGLGGFVVYDHDVEDGTGIIGAWSFLYTLVNGKRSLYSWKFYPKFLTVFALANTAVYGGRFFSLI